jgi:hypothetical protein
VPPARPGPCKTSRAGSGLDTVVHGPARHSTTYDRAGLGQVYFVPGQIVLGPEPTRHEHLDIYSANERARLPRLLRAATINKWWQQEKNIFSAVRPVTYGAKSKQILHVVNGSSTTTSSYRGFDRREYDYTRAMSRYSLCLLGSITLNKSKLLFFFSKKILPFSKLWGPSFFRGPWIIGHNTKHAIPAASTSAAPCDVLKPAVRTPQSADERGPAPATDPLHQGNILLTNMFRDFLFTSHVLDLYIDNYSKYQTVRYICNEVVR